MTARRRPLPAVSRPRLRSAREILGDEKTDAFIEKQKMKAAAAEQRKALRSKPGTSPLDFTYDVLEQAMAVPKREPHIFPEGPTAELTDSKESSEE